MDLDFKIILDWWPLILDGFKLTLVIVIGAILLGIPLGGLLAFGRQSRFKVISISSTAFIELFRNTPFMIQVFLLFYVLPFYGIRIPANIVGIIGFMEIAIIIVIIIAAITLAQRVAVLVKNR